MGIINFSMATPEDENTITLQGRIHQVKLFWRKNSSCWFYIPRSIIRDLNLKNEDYGYFYVIENTTLMLSFRDPHLKKQRKRKINYAGIEHNLTLVIPASLISKEYLRSKTAIRLINTTGNVSHEWQIQFL